MTIMYLHEVRAMVRDCLGRTAWGILNEAYRESEGKAHALHLAAMAYGMTKLEDCINARLNELSKEDGGEE